MHCTLRKPSSISQKLIFVFIYFNLLSYCYLLFRREIATKVLGAKMLQGWTLKEKVCDSCFANIPLDLERKNAPAMQAKYPELKECAALARLGLTAADTVRACYIFIRFVMYGRVYGSMFTTSLELYSLMMCSPKFTCIFCI